MLNLPWVSSVVFQNQNVVWCCMVSIDIMYHNNIVISSETRYRLNCITGSQLGPIAPQITSLMIVYSTIYSDADQRKHQSSASLAFVWGIHRDPVQMASNAENVSIRWRHHDSLWKGYFHHKLLLFTAPTACTKCPNFYSRRYWTIWNKIMNQTAFEFCNIYWE